MADHRRRPDWWERIQEFMFLAYEVASLINAIRGFR